MIPYLDPREQLPPLYREFLDQLHGHGFRGEIRTDYASRLIMATDNSVYQIVPRAVIYPRGEDDIALTLRLTHQERFRGIKLSPRGGGTGTNGQALCDGVIMDVSRHMRQILELDLARGWVRVQPGVVLDQLNALLKPHGVFFAPNLSPSSRATLGGMINTDASGKGSRVYGKTSQHVLSLRVVLMDGSILDSAPMSDQDHRQQMAQGGMLGDIHRVLDDIIVTHGERIARELPKIARFVTGYDLAHLRTEDGGFNLNAVLCGSEGTLCVMSEAKLKLTPLPKHRKLVAVRYPDFDAALRAANVLVASGPGAIETIDDTIVRLARQDPIWHAVAHLVAETAGEPPLVAINLVEFESDDPARVERKVAELTAQLNQVLGRSGEASGYTVAEAPADIAALWTLRKKGVGLLGNAPGRRRPVPFVEDTAVPPEKLADYIREFRAILDRHGLRYGMFGHVDVGCLHVRPALDLRDEGDDKLLRQISDEVVALVKKYGGVLWGEHGKGFRGEYAPVFFGPELYEQLRRVKGAFDPYNQLNPGKLATPPHSGEGLISIDTVKRGQFDRQIPPPVRDKYEVAVSCNGNGACFDWNPDSVMCPSSKVTLDRIHSPKGRAGVMREWLRLLANAGHDTDDLSGEAPAGAVLWHGRRHAPEDFSHQVYDAMNGCLACKACATQCPIKVDVPNFRAEFLARYHTRYRRPLKDYFVAALEPSLRPLSWFPRLANAVMGAGWFRRVMARWIGIVDTPRLAESSLRAGLRKRRALPFDARALAQLSPDEKARTVLIVQDAFTRFYEPNVALAAYDVLTRLGRRVVFLPYRENGKGLHIKGFLARFRELARKNAAFLKQAAGLGIPLVGLEPAVTLTYRDEYPHVLGEAEGVRVQLLQEYLVERLAELSPALAYARDSRLLPPGPAFQLFGHCTERTAEPTSQAQWRRVFEAAGLSLTSADLGCCGMCGVFGHEAEHYDESRGVFAMSWEKALPRDEQARRQVLATGHSCRSQVKRFAGFVPRHPIEALRDALVESQA